MMDWHTLAPKLTSHIVANSHPIEGNGDFDSVTQFNFTSDMHFPNAIST
jgi:hypothetical protein